MNAPLLAGKTALITGASRGIGLGIAHSLARNGVQCILVGRDPHTLDAKLIQLSKAESQHERFAGDVAAQETWAKFEQDNVSSPLTLDWFGGS